MLAAALGEELLASGDELGEVFLAPGEPLLEIGEPLARGLHLVLAQVHVNLAPRRALVQLLLALLELALGCLDGGASLLDRLVCGDPPLHGSELGEAFVDLLRARRELGVEGGTLDLGFPQRAYLAAEAHELVVRRRRRRGGPPPGREARRSRSSAPRCAGSAVRAPRARR